MAGKKKPFCRPVAIWASLKCLLPPPRCVGGPLGSDFLEGSSRDGWVCANELSELTDCLCF